MDTLTFLLCLLFVLTCIHVLGHGTKSKAKSGIGKLPPGPIPLPIVGSLFKLGNKPHESLAELAKTYGLLMTVSSAALPQLLFRPQAWPKRFSRKTTRRLLVDVSERRFGLLTIMRHPWDGYQPPLVGETSE